MAILLCGLRITKIAATTAANVKKELMSLTKDPFGKKEEKRFELIKSVCFMKPTKPIPVRPLLRLLLNE